MLDSNKLYPHIHTTGITNDTWTGLLNTSGSGIELSTCYVFNFSLAILLQNIALCKFSSVLTWNNQIADMVTKYISYRCL